MDTNSSDEQDLDRWQKEKRINQTPSLLSFLGYVYVAFIALSVID